MCQLCFADEYVRRTVGVPTTAQVPDMEPALKAVQNILPKLEARIIEFLSEGLVIFLMPAKHVLDTRAPTSISCSLKNTGLESYILVSKSLHPSTDRSHTQNSQALAELAKRGLLAPDTWNCKRAQISLKASIDVPMLALTGTQPYRSWTICLVNMT